MALSISNFSLSLLLLLHVNKSEITLVKNSEKLVLSEPPAVQIDDWMLHLTPVKIILSSFSVHPVTISTPCYVC